MWMFLQGVSNVRALLDVAALLGFLSEPNRSWLLRATGEAGGNAQLQQAIKSGALVLIKSRECYFKGALVDVEWNRHKNSWELLWMLAQRTKAGGWLSFRDVDENAAPRTARDRKYRLGQLVKEKSFPHIECEKNDGYRIQLSADQILFFEAGPRGGFVEMRRHA
ncbi:MAG: hypothetical protein KDA41_01785 [Planctomycetales bacterium]|nr:hypothetical protein [Planctomycetales bacterium]